MKTRFEVLRRESAQQTPWLQTFDFEVADENASVATALIAINAAQGLVDSEGRPVTPIQWECSCLQKKCGACAMRVCGVPRLACDARLKDLGGVVRLEPLKKFPTVADLMVDRSAMYENLKAMRLWLETDVDAAAADTDTAYEASRCLQCGCCLEICPNCLPGDTFAGLAALPPAARLLAELPMDEARDLRRAYRRRVYAGCGKSLACRDVCPAGLDVERLLVNSNAIAVWKRLGRKK